MGKSLFLIFFPLAGAPTAALLVAACGNSDHVTPIAEAGADVIPQTDGAVDSGATDAAKDASQEAGLLGGQNDRAGRPMSCLGLLDPQRYAGWNSTDSYTLTSLGMSPEVARQQMQAHLVNWDHYDGVDNWDGGSPDGDTVQVPIDAGTGTDAGSITTHVYGHPLDPVFTLDVLVVDTEKPFSPTSYLDIENATLVLKTPGAHTTCGGRWMNDDAVDKGLSFMVNASLSGVSDGVDAPSKPATLTFPYLAPP